MHTDILIQNTSEKAFFSFKIWKNIKIPAKIIESGAEIYELGAFR